MTNDRSKERRLLKEKRIRKVRRVRMCLRILTLLMICVMPLLFLTTATASRQEVSIYLKLNEASILQGEELPAFGIEGELVGNGDVILDGESGYTAEDLLKDFESGKGYAVTCEADVATEGEYPMHLKLSDEIQAALGKEWMGLVRVDTLDAMLTVKNAVGEWDGDRFRKYDGSYVTNDFVVSKGNTYYFDGEGNKATGWVDAGGVRYYMDGDGIRKTGWVDVDDSRYYLEGDGHMVTGWKDIEEKTYYFDQEGKMAKGELYIGMTKCSFDKEGVLTSMEDSDVDPARPMIALTFDDGPGKRTGELLEVLAANHAHATFFMQGKNVPRYQNEVKRMKEIGCELGSHSFDHPDLSKMDAAGIRDQIDRTNQNLKDAAGQPASVLRPPYGAIGSTLKSVAGLPLILWNIDTLDWKTRNAQATIDNVMQKVKDGDIVLMHDIHTESIDAAIVLIPKLIEAGYQLVTVSELAAARGIGMQNGTSYTDFCK
ncbi:MAG: polysaccharide deacetylase family protein [Dorea sp.]|nr:polysaccharide deacetylase family protein [Dorea sp.]MCI9453846.1 polysaccharide deacetylase family protein [Dorea sp.]